MLREKQKEETVTLALQNERRKTQTDVFNAQNAAHRRKISHA